MQALSSIQTRLSNSVAREVALTLIGFVLLFASAQVTIPLKPVPITLQTVAVMLIGLTFSMRPALNAVALYLLVGAMGAPIFGEWSGGILKIVGPTGGYLVGFFAAVLVMTTWRKFLPSLTFANTLFNCCMGTGIVFVFGVSWLSTFVGFNQAIQLGLVPFILPGAVKALLLCGSLRYVRQRE